MRDDKTDNLGMYPHQPFCALGRAGGEGPQCGCFIKGVTNLEVPLLPSVTHYYSVEWVMHLSRNEGS